MNANDNATPMISAVTIRARMGDYGMTFAYEPVKTDGKVLSDSAPVPVIGDLTKFLSNVPDAAGIVRDALDGSSIRVQAQRVVRDELTKNVTAKKSDLETLVIDRVILRNRAPRTAPAPKVTFLGLDGVTYDTKIEARQASIAHLVTVGLTVEAATAATANLA